MEEDNIEKLPPYKRLQAILSDGSEPTLTEKANDNINSLLGLEDKPTFWDRVKLFFNKIDSKIFSKGPKISNRYQKR